MTTEPDGVTDLVTLEREFNRQPTADRLYGLLDAYIERRDTKSLERALSLTLRTLKQYENDADFLARSALLLSLIRSNPAARDLASSLASRYIKLKADDPAAYGHAAYIHWQIGDINSAIELSELALEKASAQRPADEVFLPLKANLAYYYAERGLPQNADKALTLAEEAYASRATPSFADTLGYVILRFARGERDMRRALEHFRIAMTKLTEIGGKNPFVEQHLFDAEARLRASAG